MRLEQTSPLPHKQLTALRWKVLAFGLLAAVKRSSNCVSSELLLITCGMGLVLGSSAFCAQEPGLRLLVAQYADEAAAAAFTPADSPPRVEIVRPPYPIFGAYTPPECEGRIRVAAEDADGDLAQVRFLEGTNLLGVLTNAPFTWVWFPDQDRRPPANCEFVLRAVVVDRTGLSSTSAPVRFCRGTTAPADILNEITYPTNGMMFARGAGFEFTSEALVTIAGDFIISTDFYAGTNFLGEVTQPSRTRYPATIVVTNLPAGDHVLSTVFSQFGRQFFGPRLKVQIRIVEVGLRGIKVDANGAARLQGVTAYPGSRHEVQGSTNLMDWSMLRSIVPDAHDFDVLDPGGPDSSWHFYRIVAFP